MDLSQLSMQDLRALESGDLSKMSMPGLQALSSGSSEPAPVADAPSKMEKVARGMRDPIDGGAQLLTNMLPPGMVQAGNKLNNWLADKTGMVGRLPEGGVDQQVKSQEADFDSKSLIAPEPFKAPRASSAIFASPWIVCRDATSASSPVAPLKLPICVRNIRDDASGPAITLPVLMASLICSTDRSVA